MKSQVIDYTKEDFSQSGKTYDLVFDTVGKSSFSGCLRSLKKNGIYLRAVHMDLSSIFRGLWTSMTSSQKVIGGIAIECQKDLIFLKELIEAGKIKSVIDRRYPLLQTTSAHKYVEQGHKRGSVVVTVEHNDCYSAASTGEIDHSSSPSKNDRPPRTQITSLHRKVTHPKPAQ